MPGVEPGASMTREREGTRSPTAIEGEGRVPGPRSLKQEIRYWRYPLLAAILIVAATSAAGVSLTPASVASAHELHPSWDDLGLDLRPDLATNGTDPLLLDYRMLVEPVGHYDATQVVWEMEGAEPVPPTMVEGEVQETLSPGETKAFSVDVPYGVDSMDLRFTGTAGPLSIAGYHIYVTTPAGVRSASPLTMGSGGMTVDPGDDPAIGEWTVEAHYAAGIRPLRVTVAYAVTPVPPITSAMADRVASGSTTEVRVTFAVAAGDLSNVTFRLSAVMELATNTPVGAALGDDAGPGHPAGGSGSMQKRAELWITFDGTGGEVDHAPPHTWPSLPTSFYSPAEILGFTAIGVVALGVTLGRWTVARERIHRRLRTVGPLGRLVRSEDLHVLLSLGVVTVVGSHGAIQLLTFPIVWTLPGILFAAGAGTTMVVLVILGLARHELQARLGRTLWKRIHLGTALTFLGLIAAHVLFIGRHVGVLA